jgi:UDP-N-acetylmuramoyl-tripeptide--D-alanyl-D-alanine ligase
LVITHVGEIPFEEDFFAGEKEKLKKTIELAKKLRAQNWLILNYDDETVREIDDITNLNTLTFGFSERANFFATDIKLNHGTNFKLNYKGNIIPFWLEGTFGKEQIYSALAAAAVGTVFGLNLVEISQLMKEYKTLPGRMRLIEGIKGSWVLDDSESATVFSMIEAIEILGRVPGFKRKIAVLGDVVGIGKYTIEAHQTIGERVARNANLLFTFGQRAKFIAKGAIEKMMEENRIFSFDKIEEGIEKLKETIKGGDLILVDGSKEMRMSEIVDQIRKIW